MVRDCAGMPGAPSRGPWWYVSPGAGEITGLVLGKDQTITLVLLGDVAGGAGRAAERLYRGLQRLGLPVEFAVPAPAAGEIAGSTPIPPASARHWWIRGQIDRLPTRPLPAAERYGVSLLSVPGGAGAALTSHATSLMHIHYLRHGSLRLEVLKQLRCPVVWTLHDQWLMTGGHHYVNERADPQRRMYRREIARKRELVARLKPTIIAPSRWMAEEARQSEVLADCRIEVIPNGLDLSAWPRQNRNACRRDLGIQDDEICLAIGAVGLDHDPRKGWPAFAEAMAHLSRVVDMGRVLVLAFGVDGPLRPAVAGCRTRALPRLKTRAEIQRVYGAADVFVCPSLQENLPNMVVEAAASGTPTAAFRIGGLPDVVDHERTGYLAADPRDLARGIAWMVSVRERRERLSDAARQKASADFELSEVARRHKRLYDDVLTGCGK